MATGVQQRRLRILVFAFHFPPSGGGGVQRTLKHVKYLYEQGIDATVVAAENAFPIRDETLLDELPPTTEVIRAAAVPGAEVRERLPALMRCAGLPLPPEADIPWPDVRVGWLVPAVAAGLRVIAARGASVIYSTHPPASAHLAGLIVHRVTGVPWVADFRDGWTLDPLFCAHGEEDPEFTSARNWLEETITSEAQFVAVADASMHLRGISQDDSRSVIIANGVDPDDFACPVPEARPDPERFRLSHVGTLHHVRDGASLFAALRLGLDSGRLHPDRFELRLVGWAAPGAEPPGDLPITATGYVDHSTSIAEMRSASALLFYEESQRKAVTGKIYEYLATGLPILSVSAPDNLGASLVRELGAGVCVDVRDPAAVSDAIADLQDACSDGRLTPSSEIRSESLRRFSRRERAAELASVLRRAAAHAETVAG